MFDNMTALEIVYTICALAGGLLFLVKMILLIAGGIGDADMDGGADVDVGDVDVDADADGPADVSGEADASFKLLSLHGITAFFMMFGIVGLAMVNQEGVHRSWSVAAAFGAGMLTLWVVKWGFSIMLRLQASGTLDVSEAVGQEGAVYLNIPAGGTGKVQLNVRERLREYDAVCEDPELELKTGERVRVVKVHGGNTLVIVRVDKQ